MTAKILHLKNRGVIRVAGTEAVGFLQGLVTNDVAKVTAENALYAAMLTPQGKFMYDMIISANKDSLLLDVEADRKADLYRRLMMYKLRADVTLTDEPLKVWALIDGNPEQGVCYNDPRHKSLHKRVIAAENPAPGAAPLQYDAYEERRIRNGVPDGSRDMAVEKYFWLETNAEKLNGVSFTKGCYVGQELTARMKHRTTLKKLIVPVKFDGVAPKTGTVIKTDTEKTVGEVHSSTGPYALAYMRLEYKDMILRADNQALSLI